jgi:hypothetical protein
VGGDLSDPQSLNPYSYVLNNPLTLTDPTGACIPDMPRDAGGGVRGCGIEEAPSWWTVNTEPPEHQFAVYEYLTQAGEPFEVAACTAFGGPYCRTASSPGRHMAGEPVIQSNGNGIKTFSSPDNDPPRAQSPMTDSYCNVATLFDRNVSCSSNQMPPPTDFDFYGTLGDIASALTSDCAVGIGGAIGSTAILVSTAYVAAPMVASGGILTYTAGTTIASSSVVASVAIGGQEEHLLTFTTSAYGGLQQC